MAITWTSEFTVPADDKDGLAGVKFEDGGDAVVMYMAAEDDPPTSGGDGSFFVRLHSWDESTEIAEADKHPVFRSLMGRRVRVTIETIDEDDQ